MKDKEFNYALAEIANALKLVVFSLIVLTGVLAAHNYLNVNTLFESKKEAVAQLSEVNEDLITDGIHVKTGLLDGVGLQIVIANCTACHSAKMITQNRASKEGWLSMIRWMQKTQNLWELGDNEEIILTYLSTNYPPQKKGRRSNLTNIEWYELK